MRFHDSPDKFVAAKIEGLFPEGSVVHVFINREIAFVYDEAMNQTEPVRFMTINFADAVSCQAAQQLMEDHLNIRAAWGDNAISLLHSDKLIMLLDNYGAYQTLRRQIHSYIDINREASELKENILPKRPKA